MGRKATFPPKIHTRRGQAFLRLPLPGGKEQHVTLGPAGSSQARAEYARILAEWSATRPMQLLPAGTLTVAELCDQHTDWAKERYDPRQYARVKTALRPVIELYGHKLAAEFGPVALETVRTEYVRRGYCRRLCNQMVDCVRLAWRRAAGRELVPAAIADALYQLPNLHRGEKVNGIVPPDYERVPAVERALVERTLPYLLPIVADMVRLQLVTGARPGEVCALRPCDIERPWKVIEGIEMWLYKLDTHKTDWRGHHRWIPLGPQAQALLASYLERDPHAYCFSPAEARAAWEATKRAVRKSKVPPSQQDRRKARPKRQPGSRYTTQSYGKAIASACKRNKLPHWSPNQIRHEVLERIESAYAQEDARCVAGHTTPTTTAVYARGVLRAARVLAQMG